MKALKKYLPMLLATCKVMVLVNLIFTNYTIINFLGGTALAILAIANLVIMVRKLIGFLMVFVNIIIAIVTFSFLYLLFTLILKAM